MKEAAPRSALLLSDNSSNDFDLSMAVSFSVLFLSLPFFHLRSPPPQL